MVSKASPIAADGNRPLPPQSPGSGECAQSDDQLLDTVLSNMVQGLLMFDADRRLLFYNQRYAAMYGLPRDFAKPGCTLRDVLDHCLEVGGVLATDAEDYLARLDEALSEGRTLNS